MPIPHGAYPITYALTVGGVSYVNSVPAQTVRISESGAEATATMEFTIESTSDQLRGQLLFSPEVYLTDLTNNRTLFGGNVTSFKSVHLAGGLVAHTLYCLSFDAWLDRRAAVRWTAAAGATDRALVQNVIALYAPFVTASSTYVQSTNASMPALTLDGQTVQAQIAAIAEAAAGDSSPRRFYVDFAKNLHYFNGSEGTTAPYRIGDQDYVRTLRETSGLVEFWPFGEASGATAYGGQGYSTATLTGGYTRGANAGLPNLPQSASTTLNGTTAYATATGSNLHPGDTLSIELWVKRTTIGTTQKLITAGANNDYSLMINSANKLVASKYSVGDFFVSTTTLTDTTRWHHIVLTKSAATRNIYLDGVALTNDGTGNQTLTASGGSTVNIGRNHNNSEFFSGSIAFVAIYNTALSSTAVLDHYNDGITIVADEIEVDTDLNSRTAQVYVQGGNASGTGWVTQSVSYQQTVLIDRPQSTTNALRDAIGRAWLARDGGFVHAGRARLTGFHGWRAGQSVTFYDKVVAPNATRVYEIRRLETLVNLGSGNATYDIYFGALPWSGVAAVQQKAR